MQKGGRGRWHGSAFLALMQCGSRVGSLRGIHSVRMTAAPDHGGDARVTTGQDADQYCRAGETPQRATAGNRKAATGVRWLRLQAAKASKPQRCRCHSVETPAEDDERRHKPQRLSRHTKIHEGALLIPSMCGESSEHSVVLGSGTS